MFENDGWVSIFLFSQEKVNVICLSPYLSHAPVIISERIISKKFYIPVMHILAKEIHIDKSGQSVDFQSWKKFQHELIKSETSVKKLKNIMLPANQVWQKNNHRSVISWCEEAYKIKAKIIDTLKQNNACSFFIIYKKSKEKLFSKNFSSGNIVFLGFDTINNQLSQCPNLPT